MSIAISIDREGVSTLAGSDGKAVGPVLRAEGLAKQYGPVTVLSDVTLDIMAGEIHAIIGENGAGKSTFMRLLSGYAEPSAGTLSMNGRPLRFSKKEYYFPDSPF